MRFATIRVDGREQAAVLVDDRWVPLDRIDPTLSGDLLRLIGREWPRDRLEDLINDGRRANGIPPGETAFCPPYRHPRLIWGIGLNYAEHASDLHETRPDDPASFVKGDHTIIGHGDEIVLPPQSARVTSEAEVGLVLGRHARGVSEESALDAVFGVTPVLDQTAEDILQRNPRFLTMSKNFETFFAFGPEVVTLDELAGDLADLVVSTVVSGRTVRSNSVSNMLHSPQRLVAFHTARMPMSPGDIISTGTPGAGVISSGDVVEARIDGLPTLRTTVSAR